MNNTADATLSEYNPIPTEYRCYAFVNSLFKSVWKGVQTTHAVVELFNKFPKPDKATIEWAKYHKTLIMLDAGNNEQLIDLTSELTRLGNKLDLPVAHFCEDVVTMGGLLTSSCIIIPNAIYDDNYQFNDSITYDTFPPSTSFIDNSEEAQLHRLIKSYRLAT